MPRASQRDLRESGWRWLSELSSVVVIVENGETPLSFGVVSTSAFIRIVDRNALVIDIPRNCALHSAMSRPCRAAGVTLWFRSPNALHEFVCLEGIGSIGPACPDAEPSLGDQVCLRMTAFTVTSQCEGMPQFSTVPEAS